MGAVEEEWPIRPGQGAGCVETVPELARGKGGGAEAGVIGGHPSAGDALLLPPWSLPLQEAVPGDREAVENAGGRQAIAGIGVCLGSEVGRVDQLWLPSGVPPASL